MIREFLILQPGDSRPSAGRIIFCDGSGGSHFRAETDLELSHWRPNHTPREFRADTSTEICFRFLEAPRPGDWTLAVNNHLDVDGMLSVFVLVHGARATAHRRVIIEAAEMGDFWGWGCPAAQRLFQGLTHLMNERSASGVSTQSIYEEAFDRTEGLIEGTDQESAVIEASLEPLRRGAALVENGDIVRRQHGPRFAQYLVPAALAGDGLEKWLYVPGFNEAISPAGRFWPQVRAKWDAQRVCLVSIESGSGWHHDLWFPGYLWADTQDRWTIPGMQFRNGMERYDLTHDKLFGAAHALRESEPARGTWAVEEGVSPFHEALQSVFPVVVRFVDERGRPAVSSLAPARVALTLSAAFD